MNIKSEIITGIATTIAGASLLGGGGMVLNAHRENSVQEKQIETIERDSANLGQAVQNLNRTVNDLDKSIAVLNERMSTK